MSPPERKINNFIPVTRREKVDNISRSLILLQIICGLFRLPILGITNKIQLVIMFGITVLYNGVIIYNIYFRVSFNSYTIAPIFDTTEFMSCTLLGFLSYKTLLLYYVEINNIDKDLKFSYKSRLMKLVLIHFVQLFFIGITFAISLYVVPESKDMFLRKKFLIPIKLLHYLELNYYGHLFDIMIPRLTRLTNIMRKSCHIKEDHQEKYHERNDRTLIGYDIEFLMDSYNRFLKTYEYLNRAIKWQILIITVSLFNVSLSLSYHVATLVLDGVKEEDEDAELCLNFTLLVLEVVPFVIPCLLASQVSDEVVYLKEIISSRVYENKLDKSYRCTARAFLELLQTQPLSFPLLHLFDFDFMLPFKLLTLILTYLIILLQFDRVTNLNKVI